MTGVSQQKKDQLNMTFCVLSALAIIMVVAGHMGYSILTMDELFPYYSFHVPLFMFISGYFYRESEEEHPLAYVKKKVRRLIVPYLIWNLIYGLVAWGLRSVGFAMGEEISFYTLLVAPFLHGHQFAYNNAAWFVPVLFTVEMLNLFARSILRRILRYLDRREGKQNGGEITEWLMLVGSLFVGMTVVWLAVGGHIWGNYRIMPGKILFLFPCFQMGQFYYRKLEKHDTLGNLPYFAIVIGIQVLLHVCCNGLAFSAVWCGSFANGPLIPYVTTVSGIAFWLRIARMIAPGLETSRAVRYLGRNTYAVMMHHLMAFMLVKTLLAGIAARTGDFADFDWELFRTDIYYVYLVRGAEHFKMVYLVAGITLPLLLQKGLDRLGSACFCRFARKTEI